MSDKPPLAVDLDGTLIHSDIFTGWMARLACTQPWRLLQLLAWLLRGRAYAKFRLGRLFPIDAAKLPYNQPLLAWLRAERTSGRTLVLATAIDQSAADAVAAHLGLFDAVYASDGRINLKAARKAERLTQAFPGGFVYAGNERADLAVWRLASGAVVVNAPAWIAHRARALCPVEASF